MMQFETPSFSIKLEAISGADEYDCAWTRVQVQAGGFTGGYQAFIMTADLEGFSIQLAALYENVGLPGTASLRTVEHGINLSMSMKKNGAMTGEYEFYDESVHAILSGTFTIDQSYIPEWRNSLEAFVLELRTHRP